MKYTKTILSAVMLVCMSLSAAAITLPSIPSKQVIITDFGASIASLDNAAAIQKAIDDCAASGGGKIVIPKGIFLSGPLWMKDHTELNLSAGSVLKMLPYGEGNGVRPNTFPNNGTMDMYPHLISAVKSTSHIKVSGSGTLDGDGSAWWTVYRAGKKMKRGCLIRLEGCRYIEITGITLKNSPNVHITIGKGCTDATITGVTIDTPSDSPNTDGIDTWSANVQILKCKISCGDDNVAMDSESQNITIKHCYFGSGHGCSIGSFTKNAQNILVDSCTFVGTTSAIRMKSNRDRGGNESNITYSNLTISGVVTPISISSYYPKTPKHPEDDPAQTVTATTPTWKNILIKNVTISGCQKPCIIWGLPEMPIGKVVLDNVYIKSDKTMLINYASDVSFINKSKIVVSNGDAISSYESTINGIDLAMGKAIQIK